MTQVFISYSRDNRFLAETIRDYTKQKFKLWIDLDGILGGDEWESKILNAIHESHAMVVLVTSSSVKSKWVAREIAVAREQKLQIFPLIMQRFRKVETELNKLGIDDLQVIDFATQNSEKAYQDLTANLDRVALIWEQLNPLIEDLRMGYFMHRALAAEALGETHDSRALDSLSNAMLHDDDSTVRATAAVAIGNIKDDRAIPILFEAIDKKRAASQAIAALGEIRSPKSMEKLLDLLKSKDDSLIYESIIALGKIGDGRAVEPLIELLDEYLSGDTKYSTDIPRVLFEALRKLGDKRAINVLLFGLQAKEPRIRQFAAMSLSEIKDDSTVEPLINVLVNDEDQDVKGGAIGALGDIGDSRAVDVIVPFLENEYLALVAIQALGKIGDTKAIEPLKAIHGEYRDIRIYPALETAINKLLQK
ncbi:MAG: HEAT repeat domain-containing protein [Anaerolineae bacterium]|nr:HEAT repeat domain-containing protein [Anaerolineae bacterium]